MYLKGGGVFWGLVEMVGGSALLCFLEVLETEPGTPLAEKGSHSSTELAQRLTQSWGGGRRCMSIK